MIAFFKFIKETKFSLFKTLYVNFKTLKFKQAIKLPIYIYNPIELKKVEGNIYIITNNCKSGMINWGRNIEGFCSNKKGFIYLDKNSKIFFEAECNISTGNNMFLKSHAILTLGRKSFLGFSSKIICFKRITIGAFSEITWESQVSDSNYHYIQDRNTKSIKPVNREVVIGSKCWIGNRSTILPGTLLPDNIIVTSNSVLNKNYFKLNVLPYSIIGGVPAKVLKVGYKRVYSKEIEKKLNLEFNKLENELMDNVLIYKDIHE